jgi:uncharacterized membrane protein
MTVVATVYVAVFLEPIPTLLLPVAGVLLALWARGSGPKATLLLWTGMTFILLFAGLGILSVGLLFVPGVIALAASAVRLSVSKG